MEAARKSDLADHKTYVTVRVSRALQSIFWLHKIVQLLQNFLIRNSTSVWDVPSLFLSNKIITLLVACHFYSLGHMCDLQNLPFQTLIFNAISGSWFCNIHYDSIDLKVRILEGIFFELRSILHSVSFLVNSFLLENSYLLEKQQRMC